MAREDFWGTSSRLFAPKGLETPVGGRQERKTLVLKATHLERASAKQATKSYADRALPRVTGVSRALQDPKRSQKSLLGPLAPRPKKVWEKSCFRTLKCTFGDSGFQWGSPKSLEKVLKMSVRDFFLTFS